MVYIGQANNVYRRVAEHSKKSGKDQLFDGFHYIPVECSRARIALERKLIRKVRTRFNGLFERRLAREEEIDVSMWIEKLRFQESKQAAVDIYIKYFGSASEVERRYVADKSKLRLKKHRNTFYIWRNANNGSKRAPTRTEYEDFATEIFYCLRDLIRLQQEDPKYLKVLLEA